MVAPKYQSYEIVSAIYKKDGQSYVDVKSKRGNITRAKWLNPLEYFLKYGGEYYPWRKAWGLSEDKEVQVVIDNPPVDELIASGASWNKVFSWFYKNREPSSIPFKTISVKWTDICNENGSSPKKLSLIREDLKAKGWSFREWQEVIDNYVLVEREDIDIYA